MNPYEYINANNQQTADLSYNPQAKALIDSLMGGVNFSTDTNQMMYQPDETGNRSNIPRTDANGNIYYIDNVTGEATTSPYSHTYLNGQEASKVGENRYSIGIDDPTSKGLFDINVEVDPLTNKVKNLGTTYNSHTAFDWSKPAMFAALAAGGLLAAPYLGGAALGGETAGALGAEATGGATLGAETGGAVGGAGGSSGVGFGTGTSYSADALTNPLNPFYGTAQASPTSLGLVSGGGGAIMGEGSIIGSGVGLGQIVPSSVFNVANSLNMPRPSTQSKTPQQNMANYLRLPTNLNTSVAVKPLENPFLTNNQQQLANMLKV